EHVTVAGGRIGAIGVRLIVTLWWRVPPGLLRGRVVIIGGVGRAIVATGQPLRLVGLRILILKLAEVRSRVARLKGSGFRHEGRTRREDESQTCGISAERPNQSILERMPPGRNRPDASSAEIRSDSPVDALEPASRFPPSPP